MKDHSGETLVAVGEPPGAEDDLEYHGSTGPARTLKIGRVRRFMEHDIPQVAELHRQVFRNRAVRSEDTDRADHAYFSETFLNGPACSDVCPSLVCEHDGQIGGFLGVTVRHMSFGPRSLLVAVSSQFMVDARWRSTLAAMQLVDAFFAGPQDLSLADEATEQARRIWEGVGGATALLYSLYWTRLLRPSQFIVSSLRGRAWPASVSLALAPVCSLVDAVAARFPGSPIRPMKPALSAEELDGETLAACITEAARGRSLRPEYDGDSLKRLLDVLATKRGAGQFQKVALRDVTDKVVGWYLSYAAPGGVGEVLQVGARRPWMKPVLEHLFYQAWCQGTAALCGRVDPVFLSELAEKRCFFQHRGNWTLVHSRVPGLLEVIHRGDAFLTRLEGEWCLRHESFAQA